MIKMDWSLALGEVAKASPFALMCIFIIWIVTGVHKKQLQILKEMHESTVENIKNAYSDGMVLTREAMKSVSELQFYEKPKSKGNTSSR